MLMSSGTNCYVNGSRHGNKLLLLLPSAANENQSGRNIGAIFSIGGAAIHLKVFENFHVHCVSKKFPPLNSLLLCQSLIDFQNVCTAGKHMTFATTSCDITHLTLGMLLHDLGKLQTQIFCRYSAGMEENANQLHFKCTNFNFLRV